MLRRGLSGERLLRHPRRRGGRRDPGDDEPRRLRRGDFFGEVSTLLQCKPTADVVARTPLHALEIPGPQLETFLLQYPRVTYRMLQTVTRRLRDLLELVAAPGHDAAVSAGRLSRRRRRERAGRPAGELLPLAARASSTPSSRGTTRLEACSGCSRSSSACSRGRSPTRPPSPAPASTSGTTTTASSRTNPSTRRSCPPLMDRSYMVPSREEMERGLAAFARQVPVPVRYGCTLGGDAARRRRAPRPRRPPTASTVRVRSSSRSA